MLAGRCTLPQRGSMARRATARVPVEELVRELALSGSPVSAEKMWGVAAALWHLFQTVVRRRTSPAKLADALTTYTTAVGRCAS